MTTRALTRSMLIAAGAICGLSSAALAQPFVVNLSGATLQQNFFLAPASTNDFLDLDGDGLQTPSVDQLAPTGTCPTPFPPSQYFQVQYRAVGSVNGLSELRDWGTVFAFNPADLSITAAADGAFHNRTPYIAAGSPPSLTGAGNALNPGGAPSRSLQDCFHTASCDTAAPAGVQIDIAPLDVPVPWAVRGPAGAPKWFLNPTNAGYGQNPRVAVTKAGAPTTTVNSLITLAPLNLNWCSPDQFTVYDNFVVLAPVAAVVNPGVGLPEFRKSDLRHLFATGRTRGGENLMAVTRDIGSGTRNAFSNGLCLDPSFLVGENIGAFTTSSATDLAGPNFQPSNRGSSGRLEGAVQNSRLAIGQTGAERGVPGTGSPAWLTGGRLEVLGVINDDLGSTVAARPNINAILDNTADGYNITGLATMATIGDRNSQSYPGGCAPMGQGCLVNDLCADGNPVTPPMRNSAAAEYLNNIFCSIAAIKAEPTGDENFFSPGELLSRRFVLPVAVDFAKDLSDPCGLVANPALNQTVQDFTRSTSVLANAVYNSYNTSMTGIVPVRTDLTCPAVYSDGTRGTGYRSQAASAYTDCASAATNVSESSVLNVRNKIAGDFNNDGQRNWNDIPGLVLAWRDRNDARPYDADLFEVGSAAVIEILGDFNADGSFDAMDVRIFADGFAIDPAAGTNVALRKVNRKEGFTRVDAAFPSGNFFGTTLATGASYQAGDSRGDVAGNAQTPGFMPRGANGVINAADIDYVYAQMRTTVSRDVNWDTLDDAIAADFSADINGDGRINQADVCELVTGILRTNFRDVNLDGVVNAADVAAVVIGGSGWAQGDVDGNGVVDAVDLAIVNGTTNDPCTTGTTDCNGNGVPDSQDISSGTSQDCFNFAAAANTAGGANGVPDECECVADWNRDGISNSTDVSDFINTFFADQTSGGLNGDVNCDGVSNSTDVSDFINIWFAAQAGQLPFAGCTI
jgi:hypothetical protein